MATRFSIPTGARRQFAERLFDSIHRARVLRRAAGDASSRRRVPLARLFDYATGVEHDDDADIGAALASDPFLAQDFKRLLQQTATRQMARVVAASTQLLPTREGDGFRIRLMPSKADTAQVYVVIEVLDKGASPSALFTCDSGDRCRRHPLPPAEGGVVQMLLAVDSDLVRALSDVTTEVFMR
ncbi:MAG: hypothetical protein FJX55_21275 [Alphaproteobacteria bacterium]|nr:hypothetical protein [Alphaproteobacteria bacterium]